MNSDYQRLLQLHASEFAKESMKHSTQTTPRAEHVNEAVKLWDLDWVKEEEKKIFFDFDKEYHHPSFEVVDAFIKKVTEYSKKINVSNRIEFENVVEIIGFENFSWLKQVWYKLEKFDKKHYEEVFDIYHKHIYRSLSGRLDYDKIIKKFTEEKKFPSEFTKFFEYSVFAKEFELKEWFKTTDKKTIDYIFETVKERCKEFKSYDSEAKYQYDYYLLAYWFYRFTHESDTVPFDALTSQFTGKYVHPVVHDKSSESNMIFVSAFYGHHYAFKYFWDKASEEDKVKYFAKLIAHTYEYEHNWNYYGPKLEITIYGFLAFTSFKFWAPFLDAIHKGQVPLIFVAFAYSWFFPYFWFPTFEQFQFWLPKASELSSEAKEYAFKDLVKYYSHDWDHHDWTHNAKKIKQFAEKIFKYSGYKY